MRARSPAQARFLGLWTAGWLAVLLVVGMVRFGDPAVQWPVLGVPVLWALVALRPRRRSRVPRDHGYRDHRYREDRTGQDEWADDEWTDEDERAGHGRPDAGWDDAGWDDDGWDDDGRGDDARRWPPPAERTDTVERPALRRRSDGTGQRW